MQRHIISILSHKQTTGHIRKAENLTFCYRRYVRQPLYMYQIGSTENKAQYHVKRYSSTKHEGKVATIAPGNPFHLAIPVHDMAAARHFYGEILGLAEGRRSENKWQDYSLYGHQIVCHYVGESYRCQDHYNPVDGDEVPVPHFGIVLKENEFHELAQRIVQHNIQLIIPPHKRFLGQKGEQWTMFFKDPSGNNLEFKCMSNPDYLFAKYNVIDTK